MVRGRTLLYSFATDGRHMTGLGAPIIGFAPGDEKEAHTANEWIEIAELEKCLVKPRKKVTTPEREKKNPKKI